MSLAEAINKLLAHVHDHEQFPPDGKWQRRFESLDIAVWKEAHRLGLDEKLPQQRRFLPVSSVFLGKTNLPVCEVPGRLVVRTAQGQVKRIENGQEKYELQGLHYWRNRLRDLQAHVENPDANQNTGETNRPDDELAPVIHEDYVNASCMAIREIDEMKMSGRLPDDDFREWKEKKKAWANMEGPKQFARARLRKLDPRAIPFSSLTADEVGAVNTTDIFPGWGKIELELWWNLVTPVGQRMALDQARDWLEREPLVPNNQWKEVMKVQELNETRRREWMREIFGKTVGDERIKDYLGLTRGITQDQFLHMDPLEVDAMLRADAEKKARERSKAPAKTASETGNAPPGDDLPWGGPDWDELAPQARHMLRHMHGRESDRIENFTDVVWEKDVSPGAIHTAISRANAFLRKHAYPRFLIKVRREPIIRWQ